MMPFRRLKAGHRDAVARGAARIEKTHASVTMIFPSPEVELSEDVLADIGRGAPITLAAPAFYRWVERYLADGRVPPFLIELHES